MSTPTAPGARLGGFARVSAGQLSLAGGSYLVIVLCARTVDEAALAAVFSFYLLINTVGRGLCSALELHLTRAVAADTADGLGAGGARRAASRQGAAVFAVGLVLVAAATPLLDRVFAGDRVLTVLLAATLPGMAASYAARGVLAGQQRFPRYATSFWAESVTTVGVGAVLLVAGSGSPRWWVVAFALGPAAATLVLAVLPGEARGHGGPTAARHFDGLVWSVVILGGSQAVWNLGPVLLTARLPDAGEGNAIAVGFFTAALLLRIPVLLFPAVQAVLLPVLTGRTGSGTDPATDRSLLRRVPMTWWVGGGVVGAAWLLAAVFVVPPVATLLFGDQRLPGAGVLLLMAAATLVGGVAQLVQTALIAAGSYRRPALAWSAALAVLVVLSTVPAATAFTVALALVVAVAVALSVLARPSRRNRR